VVEALDLYLDARRQLAVIDDHAFLSARIINVKDSITRMSQERDREIEARRVEQQEGTRAARERRERVEATKWELFSLFDETNPHRRGKSLEGLLNNLFRAYDVLSPKTLGAKAGMAELKSRLMA
jgi:hypothetical protein